MTLEKFLQQADVPDTRRDLTKPENVRWLVNNLGIRNAELEGFKEKLDILKDPELLKETANNT